MSHRAQITDRIVDEIAAAADVDHRSVVRRLAGLPVRGRAGARIDRELRARGLLADVCENEEADAA